MSNLTAATVRSVAADPIPTEVELLDRARALAPILRARADACEEARTVLPETVADFEAAGFYRILQPAAFGGYEMNPMTHYRVAMEVAKACPSSGWCLSIVGIHNWELALLEPQAAHDVWDANPLARISSSYAPFGKVEPVEGGFRVSGRWPWSSGCDHCSWAFLGGFVPSEGDGHPDHRAFLIPRTDYEIEDNWHVLGLKGTGSKIVHVKDAFVPEYRTHRMVNSFNGDNPGLKAFTAPSYRYPFGTVFVHTLAIVVLGMADGALEAFQAQMAERRGVYDGAKAMDDPFVRQRIARAAYLVRGAHSLLDANFAAMDEWVAAGEPIPVADRVGYKWDASALAKTCMEAIELMFKATGGRGLLLGNPMQRFFRDAHAASNHTALNADQGSLNPGFVTMGGENADMFV